MSECPHCATRFSFAYSHPTLGPLCPICQRPAGGRRRAKGGMTGRLKAVAVRDGWRCHLCGEPVKPDALDDEQPTVDHLLPRSHGGTNALSNLKLAHWRCNHARGNELLEPVDVQC